MKKYCLVAMAVACAFSMLALWGCGDDNDEKPGTKYTLTLKADPAGSANFSWGSQELTVESGKTITVTVSPTIAGKYVFLNWAGASSSTDTVVTITMTQNETLTAKFETRYAITGKSDPEEGGTVTLTPNTPYYAVGANVAVRANAASGYAFVKGWAHDSTITANIFQYTVTENDTTFTAKFERRYTFTFISQDLNGDDCEICGSVILDPVKEYYVSGDIVGVTATAAPNYTFLGWKDPKTGDLTDENFEYTITVGVNSETLLIPVFMSNN